MADERPGWQVDACPPWCVGGHREDDHPDDWVHRSRGLAVPVVSRVAILDPERVRYRIEDDDFEVGLSRRDGERTTWLYIGAGPEKSIEITLESAWRLLRETVDYVGRVEGA